MSAIAAAACANEPHQSTQAQTIRQGRYNIYYYIVCNSNPAADGLTELISDMACRRCT